MQVDYGELMTDASCFACLGRPLLLSKDQEPVAVKTRKALAIMGYLSRMNGMSAPREVLADLLWNGAERQKAMQSLRQGLRQLKTAEEQAGFDVVKTSSGHIQLDSNTFSSDLTRLLSCLDRGSAEDFRLAAELWRGDFLSGFEDIGPDFSHWLQVERERVRSEVTTAAFRHLNQLEIEDRREQLEAGGLFLLKMDPAMEAAHCMLIRLYRKQGQQARAEQQFKACEREMRLHLDEEPSPETRALLDEGNPPGWQVPVLTRSRDPLGAPVATSNSASPIELPQISVVSANLSRPEQTDARHLKEEVVAGLSSFRSYDLFEADYYGENGLPSPTLVDGHELGSYLLRFRPNERSGKVAVQFEDRTDGRIVFNEIVDMSQWENVQAAASQTVSRIHMHSVNRLRNPQNSTAFAKWCQAESLMWDFSPRSDRKALKLLGELEKSHGSFSMVFSGKAMINLKQMIHYPVEDRETGFAIDSILSLCEHAIMLDPWQPVNQRAYGWALMQSDMPDQARRAFLQAGRLNSMDSANLMSVAEGLALLGDVKLAKQKADLAMSLSSSSPRILFEYYANIFFAAEDYETCLHFNEKGSQTSISGLTTRIAALVCSGRHGEALEVLNLYSDRHSQIIQNTGFGQRDPDEWSSKINFYQDPRIRSNYDKGVELVKRFFFGDKAGF